jgi:hypothetical protein
MVWDPRKITRRSWREVAAFYQSLEDRNTDFQPLRALAEHVVAQTYATSLGAATSGTALLVAPSDVLAGQDVAAGSIRIDVDLSGSVQIVAPAHLRGPKDAPGSSRGAAPRSPRTRMRVPPLAVIGAFERILQSTSWKGVATR